jgi:hypothetical protein
LDCLRLDDVVIVEGERGRVEDSTLSHVVVHRWDDRRLILPKSYFTAKPFQRAGADGGGAARHRRVRR